MKTTQKSVSELNKGDSIRVERGPFVVTGTVETENFERDDDGKIVVPLEDSHMRVGFDLDLFDKFIPKCPAVKFEPDEQVTVAAM